MKIAILSKLFVGEDEIDKLTEDMNGIISFADTINMELERIMSSYLGINFLWENTDLLTYD